MASVTAVSAAPGTIAGHGEQSTITPTVVDPTQTLTVTVYDDQGGSGSAQLTISAEGLTYSVDASQKGQPGTIVAVLSAGADGTLAVGPDGKSFVFTAA